MKAVSANIFIGTIVVAIVAVGFSFWGGYKAYQMKHGCTVDENGKATCTK